MLWEDKNRTFWEREVENGEKIEEVWNKKVT